jgi:hypothetical protein
MFNRSHVTGLWPARASSRVSAAIATEPLSPRPPPGFTVRGSWWRRTNPAAGRAFMADFNDDAAACAAALAAVAVLFEGVDAAALDARINNHRQTTTFVGNGFGKSAISGVVVRVRNRHEGVVIDDADVVLAFDDAGLESVSGAPVRATVNDARAVDTGTADEAVDHALALLSQEAALRTRPHLRLTPTTVGPRYLSLDDTFSSRAEPSRARSPLVFGWRLAFQFESGDLSVLFHGAGASPGPHRVAVGFHD